MNKYLEIIKLKEYRKLLAANIINRFGDSLDAIAFTWLVYEVSQSATWSAAIAGINMLPTILIQPLAGPIVENMRKKWVMAICDMIRFLLVALIVYLYVIDTLNPWILSLITFLNSSVEAFRVPAGVSVVPKLVEKKKMDYAVSVNATLSRIIELAGTGIAGILIATIGTAYVIMIDAVTFLISGVLIAFIHLQENKINKPFDQSIYWHELMAGFSYIRCNQLILLIVMIGALLNFLSGSFSLLAPYIALYWDNQSELLSLISLSLSLGMILGGVMAPLFQEKMKFSTMMTAMIAGVGLYYLFLSGLPVMKLSMLSSQILAALASFGCGVLNGVISIAISTLLMKRVDEQYLARVAASFNAIVCFGIPLSSLVTAILSTRLSVLQIFGVFAFLACLSSVALGVMKYYKRIIE